MSHSEESTTRIRGKNKKNEPIQFFGAKKCMPLPQTQIQFVPVGFSIPEPIKQPRQDTTGQNGDMGTEKTKMKEYRIKASKGLVKVFMSVSWCDSLLSYRNPSISIAVGRPENSGDKLYTLSHFSIIPVSRVSKLISTESGSLNSYETIGLINVSLTKESDYCFSFKPFKLKNWQKFTSGPIYQILPLRFVLAHEEETIIRHAFVAFVSLQKSSNRDITQDVNFIDGLIDGELQDTISEDINIPPVFTRKKIKSRKPNKPFCNPIQNTSNYSLVSNDITNPMIFNGSITGSFRRQSEKRNRPNPAQDTIQYTTNENIASPYRAPLMSLQNRDPINPQDRETIANPQNREIMFNIPYSEPGIRSEVFNGPYEKYSCFGAMHNSDLVSGDCRFKKINLQYDRIISRSDSRSSWQVSVCDRDRFVDCIINRVLITCIDSKLVVDIEVVYPGINLVPSWLIVNYLGERQHFNSIYLGTY